MLAARDSVRARSPAVTDPRQQASEKGHRHAGAVRYYELPYGPAFTPIQDTAAFGTCSVTKAAAAAGPRARRSLWEN